MKITIQAKIILMIPEPHVKASPEMLVLDAENYLNDLGSFRTPEHRTQVGIRVHTGAMEVVH